MDSALVVPFPPEIPSNGSLLTLARGIQTAGTTVTAPVVSTVEPLTSHGIARGLGEVDRHPNFLAGGDNERPARLTQQQRRHQNPRRDSRPGARPGLQAR